MKKVIIVHGYDSSPNKKKYQLISQELNNLNIEHSTPSFPGEEHPHSQEWLEIIDKEVKSTNNPVVLVGHSLGTRAILLYLDKFNAKVDTVILIATFNNDIKENVDRADGNYTDFFEYPLDIKKIKKLANRFIVVHSVDDSSINYQQALDISNDLDVKLITYEDADHFSGEDKAEENAKYFLELIGTAL